MNDITSVDRNFAIETQRTKNGLRFYDANQAPFALYGVFYENGRYRRIPEALAKQVNPGVLALHANTAGGRLRFRTDSPYIAIYAKMPAIGKMPHFPLTGSAGFDLYVDNVYYRTFVPPYDIRDGYESLVDFPDSAIREITVNFPTYSDVSALYIGLSEKAQILPPTPYMDLKPVVFYGSSITQGGCVSRPGMTYEAILSRRFRFDYLNLGFSGSAKGEPAMADFIKDLPMSVFVYDYDHNAETSQMLLDTHENMFHTIRGAQPQLPIILMSRPKYTLFPEEEERLSIIKTTFRHAVAAGDQNVYLIDGKTLMGFAGNDGTVDDCHPNDLGFYSMAAAVGDVLGKIL